MSESSQSCVGAAGSASSDTSILHAKSLFTASTNFTADSIESHPEIGGLFALGTYQVKKEEVAHADEGQNPETEESTTGSSPAYERLGTVTLWQATDPSSREASDEQFACKVHHVTNGAAVLDMKWCTYASSQSGDAPASAGRETSAGSTAKLCVATATGAVVLYSVSCSRSSQDFAAQYGLSPFNFLQINPRKALCLSLDCSSSRHDNRGSPSSQSSSHTALIVSQSDGTLAYLPSLASALDSSQTSAVASDDVQATTHEASEDDDDEGEDEEEEELHASLNDAAVWLDAVDGNEPALPMPRGLETWKAHDNEAWISAWDCWSNGKVAWSGES